MSEPSTSRSSAIIILSLIGVLSCVCVIVVGWRALRQQLSPAEPTGIPITEQFLLATEMPTPTETPSPGPHYLPLIVQPFPTFTPTPVPDVVVLAPTVNLLEGPGQNYPVLGQVDQATELDVIAQNSHCIWLKVLTPSQLTGWILNDSSTVNVQRPCIAVPTGTFRPFTGLIKPVSSAGKGQMTIDNGTDHDGVIVLLPSGSSETLASAYIRSREKFTLSGIPDGIYIVFFATGSEWNGESFTMNSNNQRFEDPLDFTTTFTQFSTQYTIWDISLHPVPGGSASTIEVPPDDFPDIK